jgi:hypothetical protein
MALFIFPVDKSVVQMTQTSHPMYLRKQELVLVYEWVPVLLFVQDRPRPPMCLLQPLQSSLAPSTLQLRWQVLQPDDTLNPRVTLLLL